MSTKWYWCNSTVWISLLPSDCSGPQSKKKFQIPKTQDSVTSFFLYVIHWRKILASSISISADSQETWAGLRASLSFPVGNHGEVSPNQLPQFVSGLLGENPLCRSFCLCPTHHSGESLGLWKCSERQNFVGNLVEVHKTGFENTSCHCYWVNKEKISSHMPRTYTKMQSPTSPCALSYTYINTSHWECYEVKGFYMELE